MGVLFSGSCHLGAAVGSVIAAAVVIEAVTIFISIGCCIYLKRKARGRYLRKSYQVILSFSSKFYNFHSTPLHSPIIKLLGYTSRQPVNKLSLCSFLAILLGLGARMKSQPMSTEAVMVLMIETGL